MADEDEKILKTGNLKVKRDSKNNRFMKFVDEDPALNKRSNDYWVDVNTKVQQYFGYKDYKEYKIDNQEDLRIMLLSASLKTKNWKGEAELC